MRENLFGLAAEERQRYEDLDKALGGLPPMPDDKLNRRWAEHRSDFIERFGEDAVAALIPEEIHVDSRGITNLIDNFIRGGIKTIFDLAKADLDTYFAEHRGVGEKSLVLAKRLKAVAEIEARLWLNGEWSI